MATTKPDWPTQLKRMPVFDIRSYGAKCDGVTDDTAAFLLTLVAAAVNGGTVLVPRATRCDGQLLIPNNGLSPGAQKSIRIVGNGCGFDGVGTVGPNGGTVLDLRYSGTGGKILTTGYGTLEITGIAFKDGSIANTTPFIYTTNTTVLARSNSFQGSLGGVLTTQDAIILGGTSTVRDNTLTAPFGGYGTIIDGNYFNQVRRAVYGRVYANGVVITNNTIWAGGGGASAIEFVGDTTTFVKCDGGYIAGNLIEMQGYTVGIKLDYATHFTLVGNNFYDPDVAVSQYCVLLTAHAIYNTTIDGTFTATSPVIPIYTDLNGLNSHISGDTNVGSNLPVLSVSSKFAGTLPFKFSDAQTTMLNTLGQVYASVQNTNATNNNWATLLGIGSGGQVSAGIGFQFVDQTNGYADLAIGLLSASGFREVMRITKTGGIKFGFLVGADPGAGSKQIWYDPADSNRVKYAP